MKTFFKTILATTLVFGASLGQSVFAETFTYQPVATNYYQQPQAYPVAPVYYQNNNLEAERIQQILTLLASLQAQLAQLQQSQGTYTQQAPVYGQYDPYSYGYNNQYQYPYQGSQSFAEVDVTTDKARSITSYSAKIEGEVDMGGYRDGTVFFVYGTDKSAVSDVEDDYDQYDDVSDDEEYNEFMVIKVDNHLDDSDDYSETIDGLTFGEKYYFTLCVEYEDMSNREVISCGSVKNFTTN